MKHRPDTKWKPFLVTNAIFLIDNMNYALGQGQSRADNSTRDKNYTDKLWAYRCLSLHNGQSITNLVNSTHYYFLKWNAYQHGRNESVNDPKRYPGLQLQEIPEF